MDLYIVILSIIPALTMIYKDYTIQVVTICYTLYYNSVDIVYCTLCYNSVLKYILHSITIV